MQSIVGGLILIGVFFLTMYGVFIAVHSSFGAVGVVFANIFFWVFVWAKKTQDEKIRNAATWLGVISVILFILYFSSFGHPKIEQRFLGGLIAGFGPTIPFKIQMTGMFFTLASFIVIFFWDRIFGKSYLQQDLDKYDIKYPKKIPHEKYIQTGLKKNLGFYLGYNLSFKCPEYLTENQRLRHTHVLGTTGAGKTTGVIFPLIHHDINTGRGLIFIDAKGDIDNAKTIYKMSLDANREQDFLFFSIARPELSHTYNPLQHGNPTQLKDKITGAIEWSDPYYQRTCEDALQTLFMEHGNNPITLKDLLSILQSPPSKYYDFSKTKEQHQKDITTLEKEIRILTNTTFSDILSEPKGKIDLLDAYKNKKIVYFALNTQSFGSTAMRLGKMITQDLNTISGIITDTLPARERQPFGIFIDEYQAFGTKNFINCLARGRTSGFMILISHQSIGDLDAIDTAYTTQINQDTHTKIFLQSNDPDTCELFSRMLGTRTGIEETQQVVLSGSGADRQMGTHKAVDKDILGPQIVRELNDFEAAYKYQTNYGKLVLSPYFTDIERITLPEQRKSQGTPQIRQDKGLKESPESHKSVF